MKYRKNIFAGFAAALSLSFVFAPFAFASTANDFNSYVPYTGNYAYGSNMGYFGAQFKDQDVAQLAYNAGVRTIRVSLPDWLITGYGVDSRIDAFKFYQSLGMKDITAFVGEPNNGTKIFSGLYEPVWLDTAKTQINPTNTFANYLYKTVKEYGPYVKFWEIINEPDFTYGSNGWQTPDVSTSWWNVNPSPDELGNLKAPVQSYVHELRVAYDVIKTLQPNEYVATGGIGYPSFLDAILRNTDNPSDGSVTSDYPQKGGAYFDVLSFHTYPMYSLRHWDNSIMNFVYNRNSDAALDVYLGAQSDFQKVLKKYGYDGSTYPQKQWLVTETDIPQQTVGTDWGDATAANNFITKAHILGQANGIMQMYKYGLGENETDTSSFNKMGLYGDLAPSNTTVANAPKTTQWDAMFALSNSLYGKTYNSSRTSQLALPSNIRGAAFVDNGGNYTYVLWAKTTIDQSESASASYTFPSGIYGGKTVSLTGTPLYFNDSGSSSTVYYNNNYTNNNYTNNSGYSVNAGTDKTLALTTSVTGTLALTGTSSNTDSSVSYYWSQVSGASSASLSNTNSLSVVASGLVSGTYVFRLTASRGGQTVAADDVNVTVLGSGRVSVNTARLNVRRSAGGSLLTRVVYGTQGLAVDQKTLNSVVWKKVAFDGGVTGWVSALYLR